MVENSELRKIYSELQKQLFYLIPEKWDKIYLYASVQEKMKGFETGELFFYYFPKGILKKNPVNVYEIPNKFNLNEDQYIKLVEQLFLLIKKIRKIFQKENHRLWSNLTIRIEGLKFEIEYNYEDLTLSKFSNEDKHIIWKYNNLNLPYEAFTKNEKKIIKSYINENIYFKPDIEIYSESIYKNPVKKIVDYNKERREEYIQEKQDSDIKIKENEPKSKFEEQRFTYKVNGRRRLKNIYENKKENKKTKTYTEQVDEQRERVRSQILQHM